MYVAIDVTCSKTLQGTIIKWTCTVTTGVTSAFFQSKGTLCCYKEACVVELDTVLAKLAKLLLLLLYGPHVLLVLLFVPQVLIFITSAVISLLLFLKEL